MGNTIDYEDVGVGEDFDDAINSLHSNLSRSGCKINEEILNTKDKTRFIVIDDLYFRLKHHTHYVENLPCVHIDLVRVSPRRCIGDHFKKIS